MTHLLKLTALVVCICVFQTITALPLEEYRRALQALEIMEEESEEKRSLFSCRPVGTACKGLINNCCGTAQCYWKEGYSMVKRGTCVKCIQQTQKCQSDAQCCSNLQCDKGNALWVDGTCEKYRRSGPCYRAGQCVTGCKKTWYETGGECE